MEATTKDGRKIWIYFPDQCKLCKGYTFMSDGKPCKKKETENYISELLRVKCNGVYGSLEFKCDYFSLDDDKLKTIPPYNESDCCQCDG